jgi:microcystin-dependent protein
LGDLIVKPSYQFGERDILTVDKLNLLATPVVELALQDPVNDQNFFRNGNFYSSFWTTPAGLACPANVWTTNASYWLCRPQGVAVVFVRTQTVPDVYSLFSAAIAGNTGVTSMEFGQQISGDLSATLRRNVTFSGYFYNNSGLVVSPLLNFYTANAFNNFAALTLQKTVNLQSSPNAIWTYLTATVDLTTMTNVANGLLIAIQTSGVLTASTKSVYFSRLKLQIGEVATEFVDDTSLFIQAPSVDSTMLQDGCLARPTLYVTNPGVIPKGAYGAASIQGTDIGTGEVKGVNLDPGISTTTSAAFTVPAVNANVGITLTSVVSITAGLVLTVQGAGKYTTVSVAGSVVTAKNTGAAGNASSGTVIAVGATVVTTGNAVITCLGYTPINKAGDSGVGVTYHTVDSVVGQAYASQVGMSVQTSSGVASNTGYYPAIGFLRPGVAARTLGLSTTRRFQTVDDQSQVGYLLDTITKVATADIQDSSITYQKLAQSLINIVCPVGEIRLFAGPNIPSGWFNCEGQWISRTTYAALFAAIGTYWGVADGTVNFALPDFRGRVPVGYNGANAGFSGFAFAGTGGEERHTLSNAEMPTHAHDMTHTHSYISIGGGNGIASGNGWAPTAATTGGISGGMKSEGGGGSHNTMQPFAVLYYIIKAV